MTADAQRFVTPVPFKTLSRHPVVTDLYDEVDGWQPVHIRLADEADLLLVAPATAHCLAQLAHGFADDALSCIALALAPGGPGPDRPGHERQDVGPPATQPTWQLLKSPGLRVPRPGGGHAGVRLRRGGPPVASRGDRRARPGAGRRAPPDALAARAPTMSPPRWQRSSGGDLQGNGRPPAKPRDAPRAGARFYERDLILLVKAIVMALLAYYLFWSGSPWATAVRCGWTPSEIRPMHVSLAVRPANRSDHLRRVRGLSRLAPALLLLGAQHLKPPKLAGARVRRRPAGCAGSWPPSSP